VTTSYGRAPDQERQEQALVLVPELALEQD
jgi:hypothetical protein